MIRCKRTALVRVFFALVLELGTVSAAWAGTNVWTRSGLAGESVRALAVDPTTPSTVYAVAGHDSGTTVFKSIDAGATWSAANTGLTATYVIAVAVDPSTPSTVYAGCDVGVFKSTDGAATWSAASTGLTTAVTALAIDPTNPNALYAGTTFGVFTSMDAAASWTQTLTGFVYPAGIVDALAVVGTAPETIYAGTTDLHDPGLYASTDAATWTVVANGFPSYVDVLALKVDPADATHLYAGTSAGLYGSLTFGSITLWTWLSVPPPTVIADLAIVPTTPNTMYATDGGGVYQSTFGGSGWNPVNSGLPSVSIYALAVDATPPGTVYAGTSDGVFGIQPIPLTVPTPTPTATPRPLDDFTCYTSAERRGSAAFHRIDDRPGVTLVDVFGSSTVGVRKPTLLCAPTSVLGGDPTAPSHPELLTSYPITRGGGSRSRFDIRVTDAFNATGLLLDAMRGAALLVPTAASSTATPATPAAFVTDHFECYRVARAAGTRPFTPVRQVTLADRFGSMTVTVEKPALLCNPVNVDGGDSTAPTHTKHLMCYRVRQTDAAKSTTVESVFVDNRFGPDTLDVRRPALLCVSALTAS